jgi:hypothetical protein
MSTLVVNGSERACALDKIQVNPASGKTLKVFEQPDKIVAADMLALGLWNIVVQQDGKEYRALLRRLIGKSALPEHAKHYQE